ncbi:MAG TPA: hypothetical protein VHQ41_01695 [Patescibacteria group bacterium]|jgi:hypothetical protein|nr:hypothetical protein [Patescibacteria group bacterium]
MKQKVIIAVVAIVVILAAIYLYVSHNKAVAPVVDSNTAQSTSPDVAPGDVPGDSPDTNPTVPTSDTIAVSTQIPGTSATIDNVFLSKPGFVTIQEVDAKGQPGKVVGVSGLLGTGPKQDLEIPATLVPGAKYIAIVRMDNGDKKFNAEQDTSVMKNGVPLQIMFSVSQ